jgi:hypothetical protein
MKLTLQTEQVSFIELNFVMREIGYLKISP